MKILYAAGNRIGAGIQAARIIENLSKKHEIKIAAYVSSYNSLPYIDWCLNAVLHKSFGHKGLKSGKIFFGRSPSPPVNIDNVTQMVKDISFWNPDLIINDADPVIAHVAQSLNIKMWYCSPLFLETGIKWSRIGRKYSVKLLPLKKMLNTLPHAERTFIYSPYKNVIEAYDGYEWITPYYNVLNDSKLKTAIIPDKNRKNDLKPLLDKKHINCFYPNKDNLIKNAGHYLITGDTSYLSDCLFNKKYFCISPQDQEELLNASVVEVYLKLPAIYHSELMEGYGMSWLKKNLNKKIKYKFKKGPDKFLHEVIK